jgi:hypothetical protein
MSGLFRTVLFSNFERDLSRVVASEMESAHMLLRTMCAPQAYAYTTALPPKVGHIAKSSTLEAIKQPIMKNEAGKYASAPINKVYFPVENEGLFQLARAMRM